MNSIQLAGRVGFVRFIPPKTDDGAPMMVINVADKVWDGKKEHLTWWSCKLWGKRAGHLAKNIQKGTYVALSGRVCPDNYVDKNGNEVNAFQVWIDQLDFKNDKRMDQPANHDPSVTPLDDHEPFDDELPF